MKLPITIDPRYHDAVIFDLDSVLTDTASIDAAAWASLFNDYLARRPPHGEEDHSPFTDDDYRQLVDGKPRYDGVADFLAWRGISLPRGVSSDTGDDTVYGLGNRQQQLFVDLLTDGVPLLEATAALARKLQGIDVATAAYSWSRNCQQALKAAGVDDLFGVCIDGIAGGLGTGGQRRALGPSGGHAPTRCASPTLSRRGGHRRRSECGSRRRIRTRHRCRPDRTRRQTIAVWCRRRGRRPGRRRGSHGRQAHIRNPECAGVLWSAGWHYRRPRVGVVSRLRRNVVPYRLRSQRGHARRRSGRGAGTRGGGVPRRSTERPRPRGYPQPGGHTRDLVRGQPRL